MKFNLLKFSSAALLTLMLGVYSCNDPFDGDSKGDSAKTEEEAAAYPGSGTNPCVAIDVTQQLPVVQVGNCGGAAGDDFIITANTTWTSDKIWRICGNIRVQAPAVLTIEAGTLVKGDKATTGSIVIERGAKIIANGTITNPIVMTSNEPEGARAAGDWGGLAVCGNALVNTTTGTGNLEGFSTNPEPIVFGGTNNADNSGSLRFIRIEYAGKELTADNEKNSLTLAGVGCNTRIDHIMCSYGKDDAFEWFGGSVSSKYLFSYATVDDDFDSDFGFSGVNQFLIAYRLPGIDDAFSKSNGIESDGSNECNATRTTTAIFSHVTLFGHDDQTAAAGGANVNAAINLRRGTGIDIHNSVIVGWKAAVDVDDVVTSDNIEAGKGLACPSGKKPIRFRNNTIYRLPYSVATKYGNSSSGTGCGSSSPAVNKDNILLNWNNPADGGPHYNEDVVLADLNAQAKFRTTPVGGGWNRSCPNVSITDNQSLLLSYDNTPRARPIGTNVEAICQPACTGAIGAINPVSYFRGAKGAYDNGWKYYQGWLSFTPQANNYN